MTQVNAPYVSGVEQAGSRTLTAAGVREESRIEYNTERTHSSLGDRTPAEFTSGELDYPFHDRTVTVTHCGRHLGKRK